MKFFFRFHAGPGPDAPVNDILALALVAKALAKLTGRPHWGSVAMLLNSAAAFCTLHSKQVDMDANLENLLSLIDACHGMTTAVLSLKAPAEDSPGFEKIVQSLATTFQTKSQMTEDHITGVIATLLKADLYNINKIGEDPINKLPTQAKAMCHTAEVLRSLPRVDKNAPMPQDTVAYYVQTMTQIDTIDFEVAKPLCEDVETAVADMRDYGVNGLTKFLDKVIANTEATIEARGKFTPVLAAVAKWDFSSVQWIFSGEGARLY